MNRTSVATLVAEARESIENLSVEEVWNEMEQDDPLLVDIREPDELAASGTISGAVHAPRGMLEFYADPSSPYHRSEFDPSRRVILFCASSGRSALAVRSLQQIGYQNVCHLDGGIKAWTAASRPVEHR